MLQDQFIIYMDSTVRLLTVLVASGFVDIAPIAGEPAMVPRLEMGFGGMVDVAGVGGFAGGRGNTEGEVFATHAIPIAFEPCAVDVGREGE